MRKIESAILLVFLLFSIVKVHSQNTPLQKNDIPFVGAQIFIEPGQSQALIEQWFNTLRENGMNTCRIRMFESYMLRPDGTWDFTLFDYAFHAAAKNGIRIYATLFPATDKTDIGGWKFPVDEEQKDSFARFIKALVTHYKSFPALYGWVLINEPGIDKLPDTPFVNQKRAAWQQLHPAKDFKANGYPVLMDTQNQRFHTHLNTEFLKWIAGEIRKYDTRHDIHVNNHAIFQNYAQYDFPAWRTFLSSLGGSAHASWHFGYFDRQQYALAMLTNAEIIRSGAGNLPWFMTELQGGNNTYSGLNAMCPTPEEITQWLWIILGCEGKGSIFWMLNPRSSGIEAGEWGMIDFQGKPTERLLAAKKVSEVVAANTDMLRNPHIISSGIDIVYFKESQWAEHLMALEKDRYVGRQPGAVIKSPVACFRALTERGLNVGLKDISEYDFTQKDYSGKSIIISNQISIPAQYREPLEKFVTLGGTLLVEGMSGFFDEDLHNTMNTGFTFEKLFGENISEFILKGNLFTVEAGDHKLPTHLWYGKMTGHESVKQSTFGKGRVIWLPSTVALGAWVSGDYKPLSDYLFAMLPHSPASIYFDSHHSNVLMRTLYSGDEKLMICINKSSKVENITLDGAGNITSGKLIYASLGCSMSGHKLTMSPEGVLVVKF